MPVITINGAIGSGPIEVGQRLAQRLGLNYVDRLVFAEAARIVGSPVKAMIDKEQRLERFGDRLARLLGSMLERSAASADHDFGFGIDALPETYTDLAGDASSAVQRVNDSIFVDATSTVIRDLARAGNVVIIGRGGNIILADTPGVIHVGLLASLDIRVETVMERENLTRQEAMTYVEELERARVIFFRKFFKADPYDPNLYHIMLNMAHVQADKAVELIARVTDEVTY